MKTVEKRAVYDPNVFLLVGADGKALPALSNSAKKDPEAVDLAVARSIIQGAEVNGVGTARKAWLLTLNQKEI